MKKSFSKVFFFNLNLIEIKFVVKQVYNEFHLDLKKKIVTIELIIPNRISSFDLIKHNLFKLSKIQHVSAV